MKLVHTSDWHLGKRLFKLDRSEEHALFLDWLIQTMKSEDVDVLLIAGDVFDTPTPPHQALEMFYNFLHRVSSETKAQTYIIAGNHDSGLLLEAPAKLLAPHRVKVWGKLSHLPSDHWVKVGPIDLCALPFFRSYELLPQGEGDALIALASYLTKERTRPQLLMLHHLAGMCEAAGSEQVITLSGVESIPAEILKTFDYVALGHIHKPQKIAANSFYSGSPIPLRFSETLAKSVRLLEATGEEITSRSLAVPSFREFFIVKTNETDYRKDIGELVSSSALTPMVEVQIQLSAPKTGLIDEIKDILAKKKMELLSYLPLFETGEKIERRSEKLFQLTPLELFGEFYKTKFPEAGELPEDLRKDFAELLEKVKYAAPEA